MPLGNKPGKFLPRKVISEFQVISLATLTEKEGNIYSLGDYFVSGAVLDTLCMHFNPKHNPVRWVSWVSLSPCRMKKLRLREVVTWSGAYK